MRVLTYRKLMKKDFLFPQRMVIDGRDITIFESQSDFDQYEIECIKVDLSIWPFAQIFLKKEKPEDEIEYEECPLLSEVLPLMDDSVEYYLSPKFYHKGDWCLNPNRMSDGYIRKIEWDNKDKCFYFL